MPLSCRPNPLIVRSRPSGASWVAAVDRSHQAVDPADEVGDVEVAAPHREAVRQWWAVPPDRPPSRSGSDAADASVAGAAVAVEVGAVEVAAGGVDEPWTRLNSRSMAAVAAPVGATVLGLGAAEV